MENTDAEMEKYMDAQLQEAARDGADEFLDQIRTSTEERENGEESIDEHYFLKQTPEGDNLLHVAASRDRLSFIVKSLQKVPSLVLAISWSNSRGENPLHIAARLGHLDIVQVLVTSYKSHLQDVQEKRVRSTLLSLMVAEQGIVSPEPWFAQDTRGNTPLHEALKNGYEEVAIYLLEVEPQLAGCVNNADESILFLAAAYGHENVLEMILTSEAEYSLSSPAGLTPLHAIVHNCTESAARIMLEKQPQLAKKADKLKKTALYYAAEGNKDRHVEIILKIERSGAYLRDDTGLTPLLRAASLGQIQAVRAILQHCPESVTICDSYGKTALHLLEVKRYQDGIELLNIPAMMSLINEPDLDGNTPLHLAAKSSDHIKAKVILDTTDNTGVTLRNKEGFTACDIIKVQSELSDQMVQIGYQLMMHTFNQQIYSESRDPAQSLMIHQTSSRQDEANERIQRKFSTLGLIAVILAAITFAAGFISPGGFDRRGHAILTGEAVFKVFVLANTSAMCGYTFVLFSALWAMTITHREDEPRFLLPFSICILQLSFYATLMAFVSSMYALTSAKSLWLAIVVVCLPPSVVVVASSKFAVFHLARIFSRLRLY